MTAPMPTSYRHIFNFAELCEADWSQSHSVEWSDAEKLVSLIREMDGTDRACINDLNDILVYAYCVEDWDSGEVAGWPKIVMESLKSCETLRHYMKPNSDTESHLSVMAMDMLGDSHWVADVANESVAVSVIKALNGKPAVDAMPMVMQMIDELKDAEGGFLGGRFSNVDMDLNVITRKEASASILLPDEIDSELRDRLLSNIVGSADVDAFATDAEYWQQASSAQIVLD